MIDDIFSMNLVPRLVVVIPTTSLRISVETVEEVDFRQPLEHVMTITFHRSHTHSRTHHFIGTRGGKGGYFGQVSVLAARAIDGSGNTTDSSCGYDNVRPESIYKLAYNTVNRYIINR